MSKVLDKIWYKLIANLDWSSDTCESFKFINSYQCIDIMYIKGENKSNLNVDDIQVLHVCVLK